MRCNSSPACPVLRALYIREDRSSYVGINIIVFEWKLLDIDRTLNWSLLHTQGSSYVGIHIIVFRLKLLDLVRTVNWYVLHTQGSSYFGIRVIVFELKLLDLDRTLNLSALYTWWSSSFGVKTARSCPNWQVVRVLFTSEIVILEFISLSSS